jgi:hypothetical protein
MRCSAAHEALQDTLNPPLPDARDEESRRDEPELPPRSTRRHATWVGRRHLLGKIGA